MKAKTKSQTEMRNGRPRHHHHHHHHHLRRLTQMMKKAMSEQKDQTLLSVKTNPPPLRSTCLMEMKRVYWPKDHTGSWSVRLLSETSTMSLCNARKTVFCHRIWLRYSPNPFPNFGWFHLPWTWQIFKSTLKQLIFGVFKQRETTKGLQPFHCQGVPHWRVK